MLQFPNGVIVHVAQHREDAQCSASCQCCAVLPSMDCSMASVMISKASSSFSKYLIYLCHIS